jgi:hypothetical protein
MRVGTWSRDVPHWPAGAGTDARRVSGVGMLAFRLVVVACQAATIWITWPLWQVHDAPPMLPALPLPAVDLGGFLLGSLLLVLIAPVPGLTLQTLLLLYAVLIDQTRLQPEIVSLLFLRWGTLSSPTAKAFARVHLLTLWLFAGFHKLLSPVFLATIGPALVTGLPLGMPPWLVAHGGYLIAGTELATGLLAVPVRTRRVAAVLACALHLGILLDLSPLGLNTNDAVWPWNVALAGAGFALIAPWQDSLGASLRRCQRVARPLLVGLVVAPLGFYVGLTDAYLAHNLYSANVAEAVITCPGCQPYQLATVTMEAFHVPMPPEHRLFEQYFGLTCRPGDQLYIADSRWWFRAHGQALRRLDCPTGP